MLPAALVIMLMHRWSVRLFKNLIRHVNIHRTQVRSPGQPWPKPLTPLEVAHWLDVLGKYTQKAAALNATQTREMYV